jgi:hypothetical protein
MAKKRQYNPLWPGGVFITDFRKGDYLSNKYTGDFFIVTKRNLKIPGLHLKLLKRLPEQIDMVVAYNLHDICKHFNISNRTEYLLYGQ